MIGRVLVIVLGLAGCGEYPKFVPVEQPPGPDLVLVNGGDPERISIGIALDDAPATILFEGALRSSGTRTFETAFDVLRDGRSLSVVTSIGRADTPFEHVVREGTRVLTLVDNGTVTYAVEEKP